MMVVQRIPVLASGEEKLNGQQWRWAAGCGYSV